MYLSVWVNWTGFSEIDSEYPFNKESKSFVEGKLKGLINKGLKSV
jgi:hypothetical protein